MVSTASSIDKDSAAVADQLETAISKLPGLADLERVYVNENNTRVIWGFTCNGVPSSLTWNKTP